MKSTRAVAIIIKNNQIILMKRKNNGRHYFVFPGGGVESGETAEQAVLREVLEETCMKVEIVKLLYHHHYIGDSDQYFYLCRHLSGEPLLGDFNEKADMLTRADQYYQPQWIDVNKLSQLLVYPLEIRDWLLTDLHSNFKDTPRTISLLTKDLRQTL